MGYFYPLLNRLAELSESIFSFDFCFLPSFLLVSFVFVSVGSVSAYHARSYLNVVVMEVEEIARKWGFRTVEEKWLSPTESSLLKHRPTWVMSS